MTLLAAFQALLARLSGSEEFVVGVPMASQALQENGHLVAHGVNTIPLRCQAPLESSFSAHLKAARKAFLDAQTHQRLTFGSLVRRLKMPRDPSRTPLVNVILNIDRLGAPFDFGELTLEGIETPKAYNNFELSLNAIDSGKDLVLECDYSADLYRRIDGGPLAGSLPRAAVGGGCRSRLVPRQGVAAECGGASGAGGWWGRHAPVCTWCRRCTSCSSGRSNARPRRLR